MNVKYKILENWHRFEFRWAIRLKPLSLERFVIEENVSDKKTILGSKLQRNCNAFTAKSIMSNPSEP
jgi:hypothetical protein